MEDVTFLNGRVLDYLACPNCGNPTPRTAGKCCNVRCRVALHRWKHTHTRELAQEYAEREARADQRAAEIALRPTVRIGARSLKALKSPNAPFGEVIDPSLLGSE